MNITKKTKEVYITSDNHEFNSLKGAKLHEWYLMQKDENGFVHEFAKYLNNAMNGDSAYFKKILLSHPQFPGPEGGEWYESTPENLKAFEGEYVFLKNVNMDKVWLVRVDLDKDNVCNFKFPIGPSSIDTKTDTYTFKPVFI